MNFDNIVNLSSKSCFFILIAAKYFEIFPKHQGYIFISESFALK